MLKLGYWPGFPTMVACFPTHLITVRILSYLRQLGEKLVTLKESSLATSESYLKATAVRLHENHYYRSDVKLALAQMYGRRADHKQPDLRDLPKESLERKENLCREILALADIFCPG